MMSKAKKYEVMIFGQPYALMSDEPFERIGQLAERLNELMKSIAEKSRTLDSKNIAVLAALQMAHQLSTLENRLEHEHTAQTKLIADIEQELIRSFL